MAFQPYLLLLNENGPLDCEKKLKLETQNENSFRKSVAATSDQISRDETALPDTGHSQDSKEQPSGQVEPPTYLVALAFAAVYIIWGTTYLAMGFAVETMPPFAMAAIRFFLAGSGLLLVMRFLGTSLPTKEQWFHGAVVGTFLMAGGNGFVSWAQQEIPSGIAALIVATMPLWMAFFNFVAFEKKRLPIPVIGGLLVGFLGTCILLVKPQESDSGPIGVISMIMIVLAPASWSLGSLYSRTANLHPNPFMATASQMLTGSFSLLLFSLITREYSTWDIWQTSQKSILAVLYLIVFGAIVALTSYVWLLKHCSASKVATYTYVNPIIAVLLGAVVAGEKFTIWTGGSVILILGAVFLISFDKKRKSETPQKNAS